MPDTQALTTRDKATQVKAYIAENAFAIREALPRVGLTPEALTRTALSQIYKNPTLMDCDKTSIMRSIVEAASLGLSFHLGRAYLVPFRNKKKQRMEAQLIPGYQGLIDIARRSGEISSISAHAVYEGDDFQFSYGLVENVYHVPKSEPDDKKLTHVYCVVRFKDGGVQFDVMTRKQVDAIKAKSKASSFEPWVDHYGQMAIKTVIRRTLKLCPASVELARAIDLDDRADDAKPQALEGAAAVFGDPDDEVIDADAIEEEAKPSRTAKVKDALKNAKGVTRSTDDPELAQQWMATFAALEAVAENAAHADLLVSEATAGKLQSVQALKEKGDIEAMKQVAIYAGKIADNQHDNVYESPSA